MGATVSTAQANPAVDEAITRRAAVENEGTRAKKRITNARILTMVAAVAAIVHVGQVVSGGHPWAGIVAFGLAAAFVVGWRLELLRAVRTAVVLLCLLSLACILGTLTVQRSQLSHATPDEFESTSAFAWAHLAIKVTHPLPGKAEPPAERTAELDRLEAVFGDAIAGEEREKLSKSLVAQRHEAMARELASAHPEVFAGIYRLAEAFLLTDVFRAWWFISLFYLLALNLVVGAVVRRKVSLRNLGFHAAHLGLVFVVLGATIGGFRGQRGHLPLRVGTAASDFTDREDGSVLPLGFSVRLDAFETLYHEDLVVEARDSSSASQHHGMMGGNASGLRQEYKLEVGQVIQLTDPGSGDSYELRMLDIGEAASLGRSFEVVEGGEGGEPAVRLVLPGGPEEGIWLSGHETVFVDPGNRYKVRLERAAAVGSVGEFPGCEANRQGTFTLDSGGSIPQVVPVVVGATADIGEYRATFLEVTPSFRVGESDPDPLVYPRNPAARIHLADRDGREGDFLFFADPQLREFTQLPWEGVAATFEYDIWCTPTRARLRLLVDEAGGAEVIAAADGAAAGETTELPLDAPLDHPALPEGIRLVEVLPSARPVLEPVPAQAEDEVSHTLLRLGIEGPDGESERWLLSNTSAGALELGDGALTLRLEDNQVRPPRDWRSHLAILEEGQVVHEGIAEVNRPVTFGGFALFQSDADPKRPEYSGLQVVRDPAWVPVKTGLWLLLLGISWVFYIQPLVDRRSRAKRAPSRRDEGGTP
jgi:hypothetical protein